MTALYLLNEPLLFVACLVLVLCIALIGLLLVLVFRRGRSRRIPSSLPATFLSAIVFPAAVVMALLVNDTWRRYMEAQDVVQQEALVVRTLLMESAQLADPHAKALGQLLRADYRQQIQSDWARFLVGQQPGADAALAAMWQLMHNWSAEDPALASKTQPYLDRLKSQILELQKLRERRILLSLGKMDGPKWWVMFCLLLTCTLAMTEVTLHSRSDLFTITALFVIGSGSLVYMLATHERPFVGGTGVSHEPLLKALESRSPPAPNPAAGQR